MSVSSRETSWSTQQLVEFLALVSSFKDSDAAVKGAVERAAEAFDAEVGAIVRDDRVTASIGFPAGNAPGDRVLAVAQGRTDEIDVPNLGPCPAIAVRFEDHPAGWLVLARAREGFARAEDHLLRGMARVLALALSQLRGLEQERALGASLRERQTLLERLARVQRLIVDRAVLQNVLDEIVTGARDLLGDEVVGLRLVDREDPTVMDMVASVGVSRTLMAAIREGSVGEGAGGRAIAEGRVVVIEDYAQANEGLPPFQAEHLQAAMAAPVHENGQVVGSLTVGSRSAGRTYDPGEQEVLLAFAELASLALTDAHNFEDALHRAFHDALTGLPNRALFRDRLEHALARSKRRDDPVAVLFLDLDSFKRVNDSFGHAAGDQLLVAVARRLRECLRPGDTAARFGGDEFAILIEGARDSISAIGVAGRILLALQVPFMVHDKEVHVSASIGIATGGKGPDDLMRNADLAMYRAKAHGKGRYELFEPEMHVAVLERLELEVDLRRATELGEFVLHYQPVVELQSGRIVGVEALVRWRHPERGLVPPIEFIPLAEETRLILPIGRWVMREACHRAAGWQDELGADAPSVCVNLSAEQLAEPSIVDEITEALQTTRVDPRSLILEITETVLMQDTEPTIAKLRALKALGVRLAVDDFGTGYSSLQYLKRFPIDILKIAKSFVDGLGPAGGDVALARAIIDLADSFALQVVAEGIEHASQGPRLLELGCRLGQGFHYFRPMELEAIGTLLADRNAAGRWPEPSAEARPGTPA
jgi:diguanylate cyclase (GGDEF)-like protein